MCKSLRINNAKVFYTPIQAAIRWSGLLAHESEIINGLHGANRLSRQQFAQWPFLHLNLDRIFDGLVHGDLPYGRRGITSNDSSLLTDPDLTVRHVDLRIWMQRNYPDQRPEFLFDVLERAMHPAIDIELIQSLIAERELLRARHVSCHSALEELQLKHETLQDSYERLLSEQAGEHVSGRAETTYLHIIGALLHVMLSHSPSGFPYSAFRSQEAIISILVAHHAPLMGITERTLHAKFAEANRRLAAQIA
ncbi:hypothetical protein GG851_18555 [Bordetella petrii]|nr:hypothetical protein [Bordetella petrii]